MRCMPEEGISRSAPLAEAGRHFLLRPDITFLNHGSFGACPVPVFATYQRWQRELEAEPVEFLGRRIRPYWRRRALRWRRTWAWDRMISSSFPTRRMA